MSVVVQAERHIPVEFQDIYSIVKGNMSINQRQKFEEVCQLIESLYAQDFMTLRRNLKRNFRPFSVGAKGQKLQTRLGKALPPKADLDGKELNFVADFIQLMARARFQIMTKEEMATAKEEKFKFQLPVAVNWDFFDRRLLNTFWQSSSERKRFRMLLPDSADRCLIFKRDVMIMEDTGRYINEKVDLLIQYVLLAPLLFVWRWISTRVRRLFMSKAARAASVEAERAAAQRAALSAGGPSLTHYHSRVVERKSLRRLMPKLWSLLLGFPREFTIQEPAYKEVVVLYRTAGARTCKADRSKAKKRAADDRLSDILANRNIHIKCFHDIPMADIDTVFPDKKVYLKMVSIISMIVSTVTALVAVFSMLFNAGKAIDLNVILSAGSLVSARFFQMYSSMQAERSEMIQEMTNILYDKTDDAQEGVLSMLLEDMAEQQLKEAVIAYIILWSAGDEGGAKLQELDRRCESFLEEFFGLKLDFAVEDTLPRLLEWNLVKRESVNGEIIFNAQSVAAAHHELVVRWSTAYEALGKPPRVITFPLTSLLADPTQELPPLGQAATLRRAETRAAAAARAQAEADKGKVLAEFVETNKGLVAKLERPLPEPDPTKPLAADAATASPPAPSKGMFSFGSKQQAATVA